MPYRGGLSTRSSAECREGTHGTSRRVWGKCVSIAMSARRRGRTETDYVNEIARDESRLWVQLLARREMDRRSS